MEKNNFLFYLIFAFILLTNKFAYAIVAGEWIVFEKDIGCVDINKQHQKSLQEIKEFLSYLDYHRTICTENKMDCRNYNLKINGKTSKINLSALSKDYTYKEYCMECQPNPPERHCILRVTKYDGWPEIVEAK